MRIAAIKVKVYLMEDISKEQAATAIAAFVDKGLCESEEWKRYHQQNCYKSYSFSSLAPIEKTGVYTKDTLRTFTLRTLDMKLAEYLIETLPRIDTSLMKGLTAEVWMVPQKPIEKLYSLTPVIIKCQDNSGYWRGTNLNFRDFQKRIFVNLVKKYNYFTKTKLDEGFELWNQFTFTNEKPVALPYKNITLLGDKIEMAIASNQGAQDLAYMALAAGVGELGSRGAGYVNYRPLKGV